MGIIERLFGRADADPDQSPERSPMAAGGRQWTVPQFRSSENPESRLTDPQFQRPGTPQHSAIGSAEERRAIERYEYLLRTAPPDQIEQAHAEAFAQLTQAQRLEVRDRLFGAAAPADRPEDDSPETLARAATRTEARRPGVLRRVFDDRGAGSSLLSSIAGAYVGTALAQAMFGVVLDGGAPADSGGAVGQGLGLVGVGEAGVARDGFGGSPANTGPAEDGTEPADDHDPVGGPEHDFDGGLDLGGS
ncbi:hypothetical protein EXU48_13650 [Occultella glacieicola]|uniref:Cation-transporting ATPase n=1 Tax=Occultella glacieicola TaxID=2518684 RepID=A0ABY2E354_9MICO|nr:hypothetical protein [Occultella glacieicola]TDE92585.1 hypothetical protein EXU48_13650 [Occultella glacieicola]